MLHRVRTFTEMAVVLRRHDLEQSEEVNQMHGPSNMAGGRSWNAGGVAWGVNTALVMLELQPTPMKKRYGDLDCADK